MPRADSTAKPPRSTILRSCGKIEMVQVRVVVAGREPRASTQEERDEGQRGGGEDGCADEQDAAGLDYASELHEHLVHFVLRQMLEHLLADDCVEVRVVEGKALGEVQLEDLVVEGRHLGRRSP